MERRIKALIGLFLFAVGFLFSKIFYIGTFKNEKYSKEVAVQMEASLPARAVRGMIYDRNLIPLTDRQTSLLHITDKAHIAKGDGDGAFLLPSRYDENGFGTHIIGYASKDGEGKCGIEKKYDAFLRSDNVYTVAYTKNALGGPVKDTKAKTDFENFEKMSGISLTLDYHIQKATEEVMDKFLPKGAVVVLDVESFEVLAMASRPTYNCDDIETYLKSDKGELLNRALCAYNAGSVFKIVTATSALEGNSMYQNKSFFCGGSFEYGGKSFACHKADGHGEETFFGAFANSCNCAFYETSLFVGAKKITDTAKKLGLGERILHMGDEEAKGFVPKGDGFMPLECINLGIGQGDILITPLQCTVMAATVANGGVRKEVGIAKNAVDENGVPFLSFEKKQSIKAMSETTAKIIAKMMRECVLSGTAKSIASSPLEIAGKTGSAETGWQNDDGTFMVHGWFCGFFPYSAPKYAITVFCEDGKSGAKSCVEPFLELCEKIEKIYPLK